MNIENLEIKCGKYNILAKIYIPNTIVKECIIACHGFGGNRESKAIQLLANKVYKQDIALICFDFPGHGCSQVKSKELTISNCIKEIYIIEEYLHRRFSEELKIDVFATSFGAYIVLLKIIRENKKYNKIILRSPAIKMDEIFRNSLLTESLEMFEKKGYAVLGYEKKMKIRYNFYKELKENKILELYNSTNKIFIIQGTKDNIAPILDTKEFVLLDKDNIKLFKVEGADHRMKKSGEIDKVIDKVYKYLKE